MIFRSVIIFLSLVIVSIVSLFGQSHTDERSLLRMAQSYERSGDFRNAARLFEELYNRDPENFAYFDGFRRSLVQLREYDRAIRITESRLLSNPRDLNLRSILGTMYYRADLHEKAFQTWDEALAMEPTNMVSYQLVAGQMIENRLLEQAISVYEHGREKVGQPYLFANDLAYLHSATMNYRGAALEYLLLLEHMPQQLSFIQSRMSMYLLRNEGLGQAIEITKQKAGQNPEKIQFQRLLAWLYREAKDFGNALEIYRALDHSQNARGSELFSFAQTAFREREFTISAQAYDDIIKQYPDFDRIAFVRYGYARCIEEITVRADSLLWTASPVPPPVNTERINEMRSSYDSVLKAYDAIVNDYPGTPAAGQAMHRTGLIYYYWYFDLDGAIETLQEVARLYGRGEIFMDAVATIADIYIVRGMFEEARREYHRLLRSTQTTEEYRDHAQFRLAEMAFFEGEFDAALDSLRILVQKSQSSYANDAILLQSFILENREPLIRGVRSDDALNLYARSMHQRRQQRYSESIATLEHIVHEYPRALLLDDALISAGDMYFSMRRFEDAIKMYARVRELDDKSILRDRALMRIAEVYQYGLANVAKAIETYEELLIAYPRSLFVTEARKRIRLLRGDPS
jgi:tetratricopeptide (TPR) repeat protein